MRCSPRHRSNEVNCASKQHCIGDWRVNLPGDDAPLVFRKTRAQDKNVNCGPGGLGLPGAASMDELTDRLVANVGIDKATAVLAIGAILGFLRSEGPADKVQAIIDQLPGAETAIASAQSGGGGLAGLMGGGVMALGAKL